MVAFLLDDKIEYVLLFMHPNKVYGLDGFPAFFFFQHYWSVVKAEVIQAAHHFSATSFMPHDWKQTYVFLQG